MICDLCISRIDGIWDPDRTTRLWRTLESTSGRRHSLRGHDDDFGGNSHSRPRLAEQVNSDDDNSIIDNSGQNNSDIAQIASSGDSNSDTQSVHSQNSAAVSCDESDMRLNTTHPFHYAFVHHVDLKSLMTSIDQGCDICLSLWGGFIDELRSNQSVSGHLTHFTITSSKSLTGDRAFDISFNTNTTSDVKYLRNGRSNEVCTFIPIEADDPDLHVNLDERTDSTRTFDSVKAWVNECVQSHANCSNPLGFLPSRLLKLENNNTFRLVRGEDCTPNASYVSLSYCWGSEPAETKLRLLTSNINILKEPQPIETLPLTFKDAFTVIRKFGISYLWIDRLCIMQDSQQDWRHEASQMHLVFKNCFFTIAAHGARDDQGGLFFTRDPGEVALSNLTARLQSPRRYETIVLWGERYDKWASEFGTGLMMKRAWIAQERLLSPRTIYYGQNQVYWECNSRRCCEGRPNCAQTTQDLSPTELKPAAPPLWRLPLNGIVRGLSEDPMLQLFMDWDCVVEDYSACRLTFPDDKLIALSGLANDMRARLLTFGAGMDTYLAGMWLQSLPTSLMWTTEAGHHDTYIAPSWSWASINGRVSFNHKYKYRFRRATETILVKVLDGKVTPFGDYNTGQIRGGELTINGNPFTLHIVAFGIKYGMFHVSFGRRYKILEAESLLADFDDQECIWNKLVCLPIQHNREPDQGHCYVDGLLLEPLEDGKMKRVGIFTHQVTNDWQSKKLLERYAEERSVTIV